jgi:hypothetical protein
MPHLFACLCVGKRVFLSVQNSILLCFGALRAESSLHCIALSSTDMFSFSSKSSTYKHQRERRIHRERPLAHRLAKEKRGFRRKNGILHKPQIKIDKFVVCQPFSFDFQMLE